MLRIGPTRGVIYVASGAERYVEQAAVSARSLKAAVPSVPVTLFTDVGAHAAFDDVVLLAPGDPYRQKVEALLRSPSEETLVLDVDTFVVSDVTDLFALLARADLALAHAPVRVTVPLDDVPDSYPEFNTGVIVYRRAPVTTELFEAWLRHYDELVDRKPPSFDQVSLRRAAWSSPAVIAVLTPEYNCRFEMAGFYNHPIRILHGYADAAGYAAVAERFNAGLDRWWGLRVHVDGSVIVAEEDDGASRRPLQRARRIAQRLVRR